MMVTTCFGRKSISMSLSIGHIRMMEERVRGFAFAGGERDAIIVGGVNIVEGV